MSTTPVTEPIHPAAVRKAFGEDKERPAFLGTIKKVDRDALVVVGTDGVSYLITVGATGFFESLRRGDLCRVGEEPVVLVNPHYRLLGLAVGPSTLPRPVEVLYGVCRLENGAAAEIVGGSGQPDWVLFRCIVTTVGKTGAGSNVPTVDPSGPLADRAQEDARLRPAKPAVGTALPG